jgi:hypothetical protein
VNIDSIAMLAFVDWGLAICGTFCGPACLCGACTGTEPSAFPPANRFQKLMKATSEFSKIDARTPECTALPVALQKANQEPEVHYYAKKVDAKSDSFHLVKSVSTFF